MNKSKKMMITLLFNFIVYVSLTGCSLQNKIEEYSSGNFTINPHNATQLLCDGTVYQVTSETVSNDKLGSYIDIIAESVTFDTDTNKPLSKDELNNIDWYGKNAEQEREQWSYTDIYEIYGTDKNEAVAVKINNHYYIAKRQ